jgi:hypothetical protein
LLAAGAVAWDVAGACPPLQPASRVGRMGRVRIGKRPTIRARAARGQCRTAAVAGPTKVTGARAEGRVGSAFLLPTSKPFP